MKKSSFFTMIAGTVGGIFFALGMCMCLLPEWDSFGPGAVMAGAGALLLLVTLLVWSKVNGKSISLPLYSIVSLLMLGAGMSLVIAGSNLVWGITIGVIGIVMLLCLIPMVKGFK